MCYPNAESLAFIGSHMNANLPKDKREMPGNEVDTIGKINYFTAAYILDWYSICYQQEWWE